MPVIGAPVVLVAVKFRLPVPLAPNPMAVLLFVQLYTVPATGPVKAWVTVEPVHTVWLATAFTVGIGLTTTVAVIGAPTQMPEVGVIVKVTVIGTLVGLVSVPLILPLPLFAIPVTMGLSLVQA